MILIIILLLILIIILLNIEQEQFNNNIIFLKKNELIDILLEDKDNYYKTFSKTDLIVRGVNNIDEYKELIKKSCLEISESNKKKLTKYINKADEKLRKFKISGFDGNKCADLTWIIGLTNDDYENGFPHTRNNIIVISKNILPIINLDFGIVKTLIHEKIHVYQKTYPEDIKLYLDSNNFKKYLNRKDINESTRANPDLDNYLYKMGDSIMMSVYNNNANDITDITTYPINETKYEHPLEYMAYTLSNIIS